MCQSVFDGTGVEHGVEMQEIAEEHQTARQPFSTALSVRLGVWGGGGQDIASDELWPRPAHGHPGGPADTTLLLLGSHEPVLLRVPANDLRFRRQQSQDLIRRGEEPAAIGTSPRQRTPALAPEHRSLGPPYGVRVRRHPADPERIPIVRLAVVVRYRLGRDGNAVAQCRRCCRRRRLRGAVFLRWCHVRGALRTRCNADDGVGNEGDIVLTGSIRRPLELME